jgi:glutamyl-tRNA reductase
MRRCVLLAAIAAAGRSLLQPGLVHRGVATHGAPALLPSRQSALSGTTFEPSEGVQGTPAATLPAPLALGSLLAGSVAVLAALATKTLLDSKVQAGLATKTSSAAGESTPLFVGLSHKTAAVEVREKLSIPQPKWNEASKALCDYDSIQEAAVLSTCNRFEVYISAEDHAAATRDVMDFLQDYSGLSEGDLRSNLVALSEEDASWHLLRVAAGLDSMVVGEGQILSQVKACYKNATAPASEEVPCAGSAGKVLGRLLNSAVSAGKFVRSETDISKGAVSISSAAVELAMNKNAMQSLGKPLSEMRVAIVGAGTMTRLLFAHLASHGVSKVTLLNRSRPSAEALAEEYPDLDVEIKLMDEFWSTMEETDLAFTSTSATKYIVTKADLEARKYAERETPVVFIDISVPRNVEASCNDVAGVVAYNVDDLKQVLEENKAKRKNAMREAEVLLREEQAKFVQWQKSLPYTSLMVSLQKKFEAVREEEIAKHQKVGLKNLSDKQCEAVHAVTKGMNKKLLHGPMSYLRSDTGGNKATVGQLEQLFFLGNHESSEGKKPSKFGWLARVAPGGKKTAPDAEQNLHHTALHHIPSWAQFEHGHGSPHFVSTMTSLHDKFEAVRNDEVTKAQKKSLKSLSDEDREAVHAVTRDIISELLHGPISYVRSAEVDDDTDTLRQIEQLFKLGKP